MLADLILKTTWVFPVIFPFQLCVSSMEQLISMFFSLKTRLHPGKLTNEVGSSNQEFSGDMGYVSFSGDVYHLGGGFNFFYFHPYLGK